MLTGNYFIDALPDQTRQKLAFQLQPEKLTKGQSLGTEGQAIRWVYFPVYAVISRNIVTESGELCEVLLTGREGAAGLESLQDSGELVNNCDVLISGSAWKIGAKQLKAILASDSSLAGGLIKLVDVQSKRLARKMVCDRYHTVEQRICTWLLGLADRTGKTTLNVSHSEAARALGVHRPTITDAMHLLRDSGAIEMKHRSVTISDMGMAEKLACECREAFPVQPKKIGKSSSRRAA